MRSRSATQTGHTGRSIRGMARVRISGAASFIEVLRPLLSVEMYAALCAPGARQSLHAALAALNVRFPDQLAAPETPALAAPELLLPEPFVAHVASCLDTQRTNPELVARFRLEDLFLAWWASLGASEGIAEFETAFRDDLRRLLAKFHKLPADELLQMLRLKLFVGDAAAPPRVLAYTGFGFLQNWVRVTAARAFLDYARSEQRNHNALPFEPGDEQILDAILPVQDVGTAHDKLRLRAVVKAAFAKAVQSLQPRERTYLRHAVVDHLTLDQIAATYQVHRATVARVLAAARQHLLNQTRAEVARQLGVSDSGIGPAMAELDSHVELSLSRVLAAEPGP